MGTHQTPDREPTVAWPEAPDDHRPPRRDWRDTLRSGTDIALLGILTCIGALGVVTAAAAVATASAALHQFCEYDTWPTTRVNLRRFARAVLPGIPATLLVVGAGALLALNVRTLWSGAVPGGPVVTALTVVLAAAALGYVGLTVVEIGRTEGQGWRTAAGHAAHVAQQRPGLSAALAGVILIGVVLSVTVVVVIVPLVAGYVLFGLHAVSRKMAH